MEDSEWKYRAQYKAIWDAASKRNFESIVELLESNTSPQGRKLDSNIKQYPEITDTSKTKSHHKASEKQVPTAVKTAAKTTTTPQKRKM